MTSRLNWWTRRRVGQLIAAAADGRLYYDAADILRHRSAGSPESDIAALQRDVELVTDLIGTGWLRRDDSGAVATYTLQESQ